MKNYFDLSVRVAVVTGAFTGLGLQMAKAFASQGANLVLLARRMNLLEETRYCLFWLKKVNKTIAWVSVG